tara:strand:+ start:606 stop:860 length:255 start_codon:yes stop_codon:yes gene_type:complete
MSMGNKSYLNEYTMGAGLKMGEADLLNKCLICQTEKTKCSSYTYKYIGGCNTGGDQFPNLNIDFSAIKRISICTNCLAARGVVL